MKLYCLLLLCAVLTCCCSKTEANKNSKIVSNIVSDTILPADCIPTDFTTPLGTKITYIRVGNAVKLSWGDGNYTRSHDSLFTCIDYSDSGRWDFIPKYESETKNCLVFINVLSTSSGGNPAPIDFSVMVLPKNVTDSIYEKEMYLDCAGDYIIYLTRASADSLSVLNLETKKIQICRLDPQPLIFAKSPTFIIQKTKIKNKVLHVEYEDLDSNDSTVIRKNKFRLTI